MSNLRMPVKSSELARERPLLNVADRLRKMAAARPDALAVISPSRFSPRYGRERRGESGSTYATITFAELDADASRIARGIVEWGVPPGTRLALLVRPGIEFVTLVFALLRAGMVTILIDPGMGARNVLQRLAEAEPEGFVAVPPAQALRALLRRRFPRAKWNVTVGRRWGWGGATLDQLRNLPANPQSAIRNPQSTSPDSPAAIIFTSGSTGPAKGVLYTHGMFDTQVSEILSAYGIEPGGVDLSCFPLFGLFNAAMGVTTVLPEMDFSRPASARPSKLLNAANDWKVTQAFASPAVWRKLAAHCEKSGERIPSLRQVFSCGAPVPADVLRSTLACVATDAKMHTPYGATECLPVATIEAEEVLNETAAKTDEGAGICVGRKFDSIDWRVIRITDEPIASLEDAEELPPGEIGELIVRGPQASPAYATRTECNAESKISDESINVDKETGRPGDKETELTFSSPGLPVSPPRRICDLSPCLSAPWHRMGDVGYIDAVGRFWYCGRKSQRVETRNGPLFTERIESVFNSLPGVQRSALVGVARGNFKTPVVIIEPQERGLAKQSANAIRRQRDTIRQWYEIEPRLLTQWYAIEGYIPLEGILFRSEFPVDVRHNAKINRELLAMWAATRMRDLHPPALSPLDH